MTPDRMHCDHCADIIGVYEPIVVIDGGQTRETSRAASPRLCALARERYHLACHRLLQSNRATPASESPPARA